MPENHPDGSSESIDCEADLPTDAVDEAARLTRLLRDASDRPDAAGPFDSPADVPDEADAIRARRDDLLDAFGFVPRVREDREGGATLVCYPETWLDDDGVVRLEADLDLARAVEVSLSGPGEQGDFDTAESANVALVEAVQAAHGDDHAANVRAFADFMSNHYARPATTASAAEIREFLEEYYPRNAWPSETQAAIVEQSLRRAFEVREESFPLD